MPFRHYLTISHTMGQELYAENNIWRASFKWPSKPFMIACREGYEDIVRIMLENTKSLDIAYILPTSIINTGFLLACRKWVNIVLMIIEYRNSRISGQSKNIYNMGLPEACKGGNVEIIQLMISLGARNAIKLNIILYMQVVDLFAGTGAFSYAFHKLGCHTVFANDILDSAKCIFEANIPCRMTQGDLCDVKDIPQHDISLIYVSFYYVPAATKSRSPSSRLSASWALLITSPH